MAKANETEHLLSFFQFKEDLEKKIKQKPSRKPVNIPKKADYYTKDRIFRQENKPVDEELEGLIDKKEAENKKLQDKHKEELVEELEGEDI